jgi:hypothetical protein
MIPAVSLREASVEGRNVVSLTSVAKNKKINNGTGRPSWLPAFWRSDHAPQANSVHWDFVHRDLFSSPARRVRSAPSWFKPSKQGPNLPAVDGEGLTRSVEVVTKFQRALPIGGGERYSKPLS